MYNQGTIVQSVNDRETRKTEDGKRNRLRINQWVMREDMRAVG